MDGIIVRTSVGWCVWGRGGRRRVNQEGVTNMHKTEQQNTILNQSVL